MALAAKNSAPPHIVALIKGAKSEEEGFALLHTVYPPGRLQRPTPPFYPFGDPEPAPPAQANHPNTPAQENNPNTPVNPNNPDPTTAAAHTYTPTRRVFHDQAGLSNAPNVPITPSRSRSTVSGPQISNLTQQFSGLVTSEAASGVRPTLLHQQVNHSLLGKGGSKAGKDRADEVVFKHHRAFTGEIYISDYDLLDQEMLEVLAGAYANSSIAGTDIVSMFLSALYSDDVREEVILALETGGDATEIIKSLSSLGMALREILFALILYKYSAQARGE